MAGQRQPQTGPKRHMTRGQLRRLNGAAERTCLTGRDLTICLLKADEARIFALSAPGYSIGRPDKAIFLSFIGSQKEIAELEHADHSSRPGRVSGLREAVPPTHSGRAAPLHRQQPEGMSLSLEVFTRLR
jgi:hypothetical protein